MAVCDGADGLIASGGIVRVRVEVVSGSGERRQNTLLSVVRLEGLVDVG